MDESYCVSRASRTLFNVITSVIQPAADKTVFCVLNRNVGVTKILMARAYEVSQLTVQKVSSDFLK